MKKLFAIGMLVSLLGACSSTKIADLSIVVPKHTTVTQQNLQQATMTKNVTGHDEAGIFLIFPLGAPTLENAVNDTLKNGGGNVLTNAQIISKTRWYVLWGYKSIDVTANVVKLSQGGFVYE